MLKSLLTASALAGTLVTGSTTPVIHASINGTNGQSTVVWGSWLDTPNQGSADDHIQYSVISPTIQQSDVGLQIKFVSEGTSSASVDASTFGVGYFNSANQWVGLGSSEKHYTEGDTAVITATVTQDMVGRQMQSGGRLHVLTRTVETPIRGEIFIDGVSKGAAIVQVAEPTSAPPVPTNGVPLNASNAGYTREVFHTDFSKTGLSTVDLTGRGDLTKQWFTDRAWNPAMKTSELSTIPGGIRINPASNNGPNYGISTVTHTGKGGEGFKYGYFQAKIRFNPNTLTTPQTATQTGGWESFWLYSYSALKNQADRHANEIDGLEYGNNNDSGGLTRWTGGLCDHQNGDTGTGGAPGEDMVFPSNHSMSDWNTVGVRWSPGTVQWDIDGLVSKTITYGPNQHPFINGIEQTQLPIGMFSYLDQDTDVMGLILGTGKGLPLDVADVQVWKR